MTSVPPIILFLVFGLSWFAAAPGIAVASERERVTACIAQALADLESLEDPRPIDASGRIGLRLIPDLPEVSALRSRDLQSMEVGDPAVSVDPVTGEATVSGTGYILKWASVRELEEGRAARSVEYPKFYQKVSRLVGNAYEQAIVPLNLQEELPWDLQFYTSYSRPAEGGGFERIAILGGMTPPRGEEHAAFGPHNVTRDLKMATWSKVLKAWVIDEKPWLGDRADLGRWAGHGYGHDILWRDRNHGILYRERVTGEVDPVSGTLRDGAGALATEIYSIEIDRDFKPIGPEKKMLGVADFAPSERRLIRRSGGQGFLLEGPRVHAYTIAGRDVHLMLFSSRDYYHKNYTILAAVSHDGPQGHFELYRVHGKVVNLAQAIVDRYPVLRGVGRAYPFGNQGRRAILHAYRGDASGRSLLITDLDVLESADNAAGIEIRFNLERTP